MFKKVFKGSQKDSQQSQNQTFNTIQKLEQQSQTLEARKEYLDKQVDNELNKAKALLQQGKRSQAMTVMQRKKMLEQQQKNLDNQILRINESLLNLQGARSTLEAVSTMREASKATKKTMNEMNMTQIDNVIDEIQDTNDELRQVNQALETPMGMGLEQNDIDDELAALQNEVELEDQVNAIPQKQQIQEPQYASQLPSVPSQKVQQPQKQPQKKQQTVDDELSALQAELG